MNKEECFLCSKKLPIERLLECYYCKNGFCEICTDIHNVHKCEYETNRRRSY